MRANKYRHLELAMAALLFVFAGYCWLNILAPNGPALWLKIEVELPLEYSHTEFPVDLVRKTTRDTALSLGIAYNQKLPISRIFVLPKKDMEKMFGDKIIAGIYFHHPLMQPKMFIAKQRYDHLTGREMVRGIMRYLNDIYPDQFDIRRIPLLERKMARVYQSC